MYRFQQRLKNFKQRLKLWNKQNFGNIFEAQRHLNDQMNLLQMQIRNHGLTEELKEQENLLKQQLEERRSQEEVLWRQKSHIQWLKEGEHNTKLFHRSMIQRRHTNHITQLVMEQGQILQAHEDLEQELVSYYQNLLVEPPGDRSSDIDKITQNIPHLITQEKNDALTRPIMIEEVDLALQDTPEGKSPGPDGFTMDFFHFCWPMVREEVWELIEDSRTSGQVLPALNATFLALIPKEE
jgi:hypothetical protein